MVLFLKRKNDLEYICSHHSNWENRKTTLQKDKSLIYKTKILKIPFYDRIIYKILGSKTFLLYLQQTLINRH